MKTIYIKRKCLCGAAYFIIALLCIFSVSCAGSNKYSMTDWSGSQDTGVAGREYEEAGHHIVAALSSGNAEALKRAIYKRVLLDRAFEGMYQKSQAVKEVRAKLYSALDQAGIIMTGNLGKGTRLTFVRTRLVNGEQRALIRVNMGDRGLSYLDFILGKDEHGTVKIIDWHDYAQGQLYSDSLRQALVLMLPQDEMLMRKLLNVSAVNEKAVRQFSELSRLARGKKYEQWLEKYKELPDKLKYSRIVLVTRALITSAMEYSNEYRLALKDVKRYIGDDPALSLLLVDHYLLEKDFKAAHRALDRLSDFTGGDAAIDFLKANICLAEKHYHQSTKYAQTAIRQDSNFEDAYLTLLVASVYSRQYEITVNTLDHLEFNFGYEFEPDEIARLSGYEEFSRSLIFAAWKADKLSSLDR
jgi:hypothetical protein